LLRLYNSYEIWCMNEKKFSDLKIRKDIIKEIKNSKKTSNIESHYKYIEKN